MGEMVTSILLHGAAELIADLGGDPATIAALADIPLTALSDPAVLVLGYAVSHFYELAAQELRCRNFGLLMAQRSSLAVLGPVWLLLDSAGTIGQMADDLVSNFNLYSEAFIIGMERTHEGLLISFEGRAGHTSSEVQMMEYSLALSCQEIRRYSPPGWSPAMVQFRHSAPAELAMHRRAFGPNLMFEQDGNLIFLDAGTLRQERHFAQPTTRSSAQRDLRELSSFLHPSLSARVETAVRARGALPNYTMARTCAVLGMTERTLQRGLAAESTSFKRILETVRADLALKYVRQTSLPMCQIAELLGYSEQSAFARAFARWHKHSATAVRQMGRTTHYR